MRKIYLGLLFSIYLSSCNSRPTNAPNLEQITASDSSLKRTQSYPDSSNLKLPEPVKQNLKEFKEVFAQFLKTIHMQNTVAFNQYIYPDYGLYIIEQPGAVPKFTQLQDISTFKRNGREQPFFSIKNDLKACELRTEPLPTFNCDGQAGNSTGFSKQGCFVDAASTFQKNEAYKYAGLSEPEIKQIEKILRLTTKTVIHTQSAYKFHFGLINGKWYVLFIDLIIPCSA